ncbi:hypothetical protein EAI26_10725 [Lactobacillus sp. 0.1XD8-4]|nr:hypothetical protein [Lactobacillus sp. 0.1XD8-4]
MKKLLIYKQKSHFIIERVNQFNHATKRYFISEQGLKEGLLAYHRNNELDQYELEVSEDLFALVTKMINSKEFHE